MALSPRFCNQRVSAHATELLLGLGLFLEIDDPAVGLNPHDAARPRLGLGHGKRGDRHQRLVLLVGPDHVLKVHPVKLVARENQDKIVRIYR